MIDLELLRQDFEAVSTKIRKKDPEFDIDKLVALDKQVRALNVEVEELRRQKNELSKNKGSAISKEIIEQSKKIGQDLKDKEESLEAFQVQFEQLYLCCPNIPVDEV